MKHSSNGLIRLIAVFKLFKASLLIAIGIGVFKVMQHGDGMLYRFVDALGLDPGDSFVEHALSKAASIPPDKLKALGIVSFVYAALFLTEGIGLWLLKRWAEWFTIIITASLIPVEIYEIHHHATISKVVVLVINVGVLIYLILRVRKEAHAA
jgi:uncharacterized membrane protein (DUF2068 family)